MNVLFYALFLNDTIGFGWKVKNLQCLLKNCNFLKFVQEKLQQNGEVSIRYTVIDTSGPDHDKTFIVKVECNGKELATGKGKTKKGAEMNAAEKALEFLGE